MNQSNPSYRGIIVWLMIVCALIILMVVVGGITRLTDSGLSMVDWRPIMGVIPPLTEADWLKTFAMYQQYPEYLELNRGMSLEDFKSIFYWEYGHRLLGRVLGLVYLIPFLVFWVRQRLDKPLLKKLGFAFFLGALQGLMGWYMVMSGLVDEPRVSHYRLAAHLGLALGILAYLFWVAMDLVERDKANKPLKPDCPGMRKLALFTTLLLSLQIMFGAFTAGLHAGWGYNTFPTMNGEWIAAAVGELSPFWLNLFESTASIQFMHRLLGTLLLVSVCILWLGIFTRPVADGQKVGLHLLLASVIVQYALGVYILVNVVPLVGASLHQAVACLVLLAAIYVNFQFRKPAPDLYPPESKCAGG